MTILLHLFARAWLLNILIGQVQVLVTRPFPRSGSLEHARDVTKMIATLLSCPSWQF